MSLESSLVPAEGHVQRVVLLGDPRLRQVAEPVAMFDHPEFGETHTREDGMFDLAVNGGGQLTLVYEKNAVRLFGL